MRTLALSRNNSGIYLLGYITQVSSRLNTLLVSGAIIILLAILDITEGIIFADIINLQQII